MSLQSDFRQMTDDDLMAAIHDCVCGTESDGGDIFEVYVEDLNELFKLVKELRLRAQRGWARCIPKQNSLDN